LSRLVDVLRIPDGEKGGRNFLTSSCELGGTLLVWVPKSNQFVVGGYRAQMDRSKSVLVVLGESNTIRKDVDCSEQLKKDKGCADPVKHKEHLRSMSAIKSGKAIAPPSVAWTVAVPTKDPTAGPRASDFPKRSDWNTDTTVRAHPGDKSMTIATCSSFGQVKSIVDGKFEKLAKAYRRTFLWNHGKAQKLRKMADAKRRAATATAAKNKKPPSKDTAKNKKPPSKDTAKNKKPPTKRKAAKKPPTKRKAAKKVDYSGYEDDRDEDSGYEDGEDGDEDDDDY
ncbi:hypothetical protein THAOC_09330, partial [Thalassiosira oceanica]